MAVVKRTHIQFQWHCAHHVMRYWSMLPEKEPLYWLKLPTDAFEDDSVVGEYGNDGLDSIVVALKHEYERQDVK